MLKSYFISHGCHHFVINKCKISDVVFYTDENEYSVHSYLIQFNVFQLMTTYQVGKI